MRVLLAVQSMRPRKHHNHIGVLFKLTRIFEIVQFRKKATTLCGSRFYGATELRKTNSTT